MILQDTYLLIKPLDYTIFLSGVIPPSFTFTMIRAEAGTISVVLNDLTESPFLKIYIKKSILTLDDSVLYSKFLGKHLQ